uniref:Uncharacterized protein n=1 Tax=Neisseria meningitidis alpha153 TaxID=663926 RepID=C6SBK1_NEIME|nr:hypothetical protein predicted by Glimmer/Critica [Neisseria meningitidis alpha153]
MQSAVPNDSKCRLKQTANKFILSEFYHNMI